LKDIKGTPKNLKSMIILFSVQKLWKQECVKQFFAEEELLIGKKFWGFIRKSEDGYEIALDE
jgi:hypothetical protein